MVSDYREEEKGVVLLLLIILIPVVIGMLGLAIDIGVFFLNRSSMQQTADAITLSGVQTFENYKTSPLDTFSPDVRDFKDVKIVVLAMLLAQVTTEEYESSDGSLFTRGFRGINDEAVGALTDKSVFFNHAPALGASGFEAECEIGSVDLNHFLHMSNCAKFGNVLIKVTRGVRCYSGNSRYFCSLEKMSGINPDSWQFANSVELNIRVDGSGSFFARTFLGADNTDIGIHSGSYLGLNPPVCGQPDCDTMLGVMNAHTLPICRLITGFE